MQEGRPEVEATGSTRNQNTYCNKIDSDQNRVIRHPIKQ